MKLHKLFLALSLLSTVATAEVREIGNLDAGTSLISPDTLVIFDIDNTLIEPVQSVGGDQWFSRMVEDYLADGHPTREAHDLAVARWTRIQPVTAVKTIESQTAAYVADLQARGIKVIALTARPDFILDATLRQLASVGIDMRKTSLSDADVRFDLERPVLFSRGILSVNNTNKGTALLRLLAATGHAPRRIVFFDDKVKNVTDVDAKLAEVAGLEHYELRYGAADPQVQAYDHDVATLQESLFGSILTDDQARRLLAD